jgi:hypothetical protein
MYCAQNVLLYGRQNCQAINTRIMAATEHNTVERMASIFIMGATLPPKRLSSEQLTVNKGRCKAA